MITNDLKFFQSVSEGSTGGPIAMTIIPVDALVRLFPDVLLAELKTGAIHYIKVFVVNTSPTDTLEAAAAFMTQPADGESLALALGGVSDSDPTPLVFQDHPNYPGGLALGSLVPGQSAAVWIRRVTPVMPDLQEPAFFQLFVRGLAPDAVTAVLVFPWGLEKVQEDDLTTKLSYEFSLQATDERNMITMQSKPCKVLTLSGGVHGEQNYSILPGQIDFEVPLLASSADFVMVQANQPISMKLNDAGNTPVPQFKFFVFDGAGITKIFITNPDASLTVSLKVIQAKK